MAQLKKSRPNPRRTRPAGIPSLPSRALPSRGVGRGRVPMVPYTSLLLPGLEGRPREDTCASRASSCFASSLNVGAGRRWDGEPKARKERGRAAGETARAPTCVTGEAPSPAIPGALRLAACSVLVLGGGGRSSLSRVTTLASVASFTRRKPPPHLSPATLARQSD